MASQQPILGFVQRLVASLRRRTNSRQTRLYGVGAPRTGTHSVAAIFDRTLRARHEPGLRAAMKAVLAHHRGRMSFDELRRFVRGRDERWRLDVDASHVNVFLVEALLAEFADARFLLTLRDCYSWTDAALNHTVNSRQWSEGDRQYLEFYFGGGNGDYSRHDEFLRQRGLPSIDCHLAAWSRHNERALATIPPARLLVLRTHEISQSLELVAEFAGVPAARIDTGFHARGVAKARHGLLDRVDRSYLEDRVAAHCGALMGRFFPEVASLADARALEASRR